MHLKNTFKRKICAEQKKRRFFLGLDNKSSKMLKKKIWTWINFWISQPKLKLINIQHIFNINSMKKLTKLKLPFSIRQNLKLITEIDEVEV